MSPDARWKRQEREIAATLGTRRLPNVGAGQPDCRAAGWAFQVKTRRTLPAWLIDAMHQAARDCAADERPAVILSEVRQGMKARRLVVVALADWCAITGAVKELADG